MGFNSGFKGLMYLLVYYICYEDNRMSHVNKKRKLKKETRL